VHSIDRRVVYMLESGVYEADNTFRLAFGPSSFCCRVGRFSVGLVAEVWPS
jgi:hypothetical protein